LLEENLKDKFANATKWSSITEIAAKVISPVTNMILARIISPEAFGIVATATMIMSFTDMFTDAGFQKYLVQHDFRDDDEKYKFANVAFWTNLGISIFLWLVIIILRDQIAVLVGNPGLGNVIAIACVQLLLTSFSSIQMALYRRDFDFKTLFVVRMVSVCIPIAITIPLALIGLSYWTLIIGNIFTTLSYAVILTAKSKWKPHLYYKVKILKEMISFSIWSLVEAISIWFTTWVDVFIIGTTFSQYYLGLYKTSTAMVNSLINIITASTIPVLFSALSRLKNDDSQFKYMFFKTQRFVSILVFPLGVGIFLYRNLATEVFLGNQWGEASTIIGNYALAFSLLVVFGYYCSEVYRAKGRPKLSFIAQILHLVVLIPTCIISSRYGFMVFVYARSWILIEFILVHLLIMKIVMGVSILKTVKNIFPMLSSSAAMGALGYFLQLINKGLLWSLVSIILCTLFYFGVLYLFPSMKLDMRKAVKDTKSRIMFGKNRSINYNEN
jgi:PST family polysaccharide transporter